MKNKFLLFTAIILSIIFARCKKNNGTQLPPVDYTFTDKPFRYFSTQIPFTDTIQSFSTTWIVPSLAHSDSTIFWWNGLDGGRLQCVLQWEVRHGAIANWYFTDDYHSGQFVSVSPGDTITGVIKYLYHANDSFYYKESFIGHPAADVTFARSYLATELDECMEAYINTYLGFPQDTLVRMTAIDCITTTGAHPPDLKWTIYSPDIKTPAGNPPLVIVNPSSSNGEVDFYIK